VLLLDLLKQAERKPEVFLEIWKKVKMMV